MIEQCAALGAPRDGKGAAYVFSRTSGTWREQQKLRPTSGASVASFGSAVAVSKDSVVVGASDDSTEADRAGSAYVFVRSGSMWAEQQLYLEQPGYGTARMLTFPVRASATPAAIRRPAPRLGEHTAEVLDELGVTPSDIDRLVAAGTIALAPASNGG